jgi:hypothetical protein
MYGSGVRDSFNNDRVNVNVHNNFDNRGYGGWHEGWRNGGYWGVRPSNADQAQLLNAVCQVAYGSGAS